ncbi:hypothetical protein BH10ACI3_BH10ACI3_18590 [soil metagenome]
MSLHVLQLGPYPPPEGGISRNMLAIRDEVRLRGGRCSIIATSKSSRVDDEADVYHPRSPLALLKLLSSLKFDVLHLHVGGEVTPRVLSLASAAAFFGRGKSVLTLHSGAYPLTPKAKAASPASIRGRIFRRFSRIIAVNDAIADVFRRYGVDSERIEVILPFALSLPDEKVAVPHDLAAFFQRHSPLLLAVGGLEEDYDPLFQIEAMKAVLTGFPNAGLMIVGDGSMREQVEQVAASSGYADSIFIAGNVNHAVTLHQINDADILLRTTRFDGDAISVREALFLGTPVIATDNGMRPDGVHLIGIGDKEGLADGVKMIAKAGKTAAIVNPTNNSNITAVVELYRNLSNF